MKTIGWQVGRREAHYLHVPVSTLAPTGTSLAAITTSTRGGRHQPPAIVGRGKRRNSRLAPSARATKPIIKSRVRFMTAPQSRNRRACARHMQRNGDATTGARRIPTSNWGLRIGSPAQTLPRIYLPRVCRRNVQATVSGIMALPIQSETPTERHLNARIAGCPLFNRTGDGREYVIGVGTDERMVRRTITRITASINRVFRDVLPCSSRHRLTTLSSLTLCDLHHTPADGPSPILTPRYGAHFRPGRDFKSVARRTRAGHRGIRGDAGSGFW